MQISKEDLIDVLKVLAVVRDWSGETADSDGKCVILESDFGESFTLDDLNQAMYIVDLLIKERGA